MEVLTGKTGTFLMRPRVDQKRLLIRRNTGFGIPEAILSLVILAAALLGLTTTANYAGNIINKAHLRTAAMDQARTQLEELLAQPYDSLSAGESAVDRVHMEWTVTNRNSAKEIVFVYWYSVRGGTRVDTLTAARRRS